MRDAFITGLQSNSIPQHLLKTTTTLDLKTMFTQTRTLDSTQKSSERYGLQNLTSFPIDALTSPPVPPE